MLFLSVRERHADLTQLGLADALTRRGSDRRLRRSAPAPGILLSSLLTLPQVGAIEPNPRPWLTRREWEHLYQVSVRRVEEASDNKRLEKQRIDLDDQMLWMSQR